jgi:cytochrome c
VHLLQVRAAVLLAAALVAGAYAARGGNATEGDAARGERVFQRCYACHSVDPNETARLQGPSLFGVMSRRAAALPGFEYSEAMKARGAAGLLWTPDTLDRFIADPDAFVPGTAMGLPPLNDAQARADVIAYLSAQR